MTSAPIYPPARRLDLVEQLPTSQPSIAVADPYRWLEDVASAESQSWLEAQDQLAQDQLGALGRRGAFHARLTALLAAGMVSSPAWRGERRFFLRRSADQEHAVLLTTDPDGTERILLDPIAIDPSGTTTLDTWQPSKDGRLLAYQLSEGGDEESILRVMDVATGDTVDGPIDRCRYSPVGWLPGAESFYYVRRLAPTEVPAGEEQYHRRVWLHRVGTDSSQDVLVFGDGFDKTTFFSASVSMNGRWLIVSASQGTAPRNDLWIADIGDGALETPDLRVVQLGIDAQTSVHIGRDERAYIFTDRDAPRGRLLVGDPTDLRPETWTDLLPQDPEAVLEDYAILDGGPSSGGKTVLLASWTRHAIGELTVHDLATGVRTGEVALPGLGSLGGLADRPEGGTECWFGYTDHTTSSSVFHYDTRTGHTELYASRDRPFCTGTAVSARR
jgi:prolyl oligopeptidase